MLQSVAKSEYHHGDLRHALLETCKAMVVETGPDQISMRAVAARIGISPSAAYHHFPDKAALLSELAHLIMVEMGQTLENAFNGVAGKSEKAARARFKEIGLAYVNYAINNHSLFQLAFGPWCNHVENDREEALSWQVLIGSLSELAAFGLIKPSDIPAKAMLAWTSVHGAAYLLADNAMPKDSAMLIVSELEKAIISN
jgi:AcrR family transcriptional regulator